MYLLTCQHSNIAGVFRVPDGYAAEDLQWSIERVAEGFRDLASKGFANRCETTKWVWVVKHLEWNPPENPNQRKSAARLVEQIPDACSWKADFMRVCAPLLWPQEVPTPNPHATLPEPFANQEQEQEKEQKRKTKAPPIPPAGGGRSSARRLKKTFRAFAEECREAGEKLIPPDDPVFAHAEDMGIPVEFVQLAWRAFAHKYRDTDRQQKDWRAHFRNAVRGNWANVWFCRPDGTCELTTVGVQLKRERDAENERRAKQVESEHEEDEAA
jgi:hypothetical protein